MIVMRFSSRASAGFGSSLGVRGSIAAAEACSSFGIGNVAVRCNVGAGDVVRMWCTCAEDKAAKHRSLLIFARVFGASSLVPLA